MVQVSKIEIARVFDDIGHTLANADDSRIAWHRDNFRVHRKRYEHDLDLVQSLHRGGDILEVGAAPFHFTAALKLSGYPVVGLDLDPGRCEFFVRRYGLSIDGCDIERERLPYPDEKFDCVVFAEVFEHLRWDPLLALSEVNRVMTPGGRLLFTTPNPYSLQNAVSYLLGRGLALDPVAAFSQVRTAGHMGHIREYSRSQIRRFLSMNNFAIRQSGFHHYHYPPSLKGVLARVAFTVLPRRFRTIQVIVAEKTGPSPGLAPLPR